VVRSFLGEALYCNVPERKTRASSSQILLIIEKEGEKKIGNLPFASAIFDSIVVSNMHHTKTIWAPTIKHNTTTSLHVDAAK